MITRVKGGKRIEDLRKSVRHRDSVLAAIFFTSIFILWKLIK